MSLSGLKLRIAIILRHNPWIMAILYRFWRLFQTKYSIGVIGVLIDEQERILLVEHVFHPRHPWGLPGGWVNHKENPATALQREFAEELSLSIHVGPLLFAEFDHGRHLDIAYLCTSEDVTISRLSHELLQFRWYTYGSLPDLHHFHYRAIEYAININKESGGVHGNNTAW